MAMPSPVNQYVRGNNRIHASIACLGQGFFNHDLLWWTTHMQIIYWTVGIICSVITVFILAANFRAARKEKALEKDRHIATQQQQHLQALQQLESRMALLDRSDKELRGTLRVMRRIQWTTWFLFLLLLGGAFYYERIITSNLEQTVRATDAAKKTAAEALNEKKTSSTLSIPKAGVQRRRVHSAPRPEAEPQ
jgi:hypothetical protein